MPIISAFGGLSPRTSWHLIPENAATLAHDVKLRNGRLEAWREREDLGLGDQGAITLIVDGCCYLTWADCVTYTTYLPDYNRSFLTGRLPMPETIVLGDCTSPTYLYLGVPAPAVAPEVSGWEPAPQGGGIVPMGGISIMGGTTPATTMAPMDRDHAARTYVYTYVNIFGEESAPSPASNQITVKDGEPVNVYFSSVVPADFGIVQINLYRTATAFRDGNEKEQAPLTEYLLVDQFSVPLTSTTDMKLDKNLGPAITTEEVRMPPADLREIRHIEDTGVLTGVTTNQVHFSENLQPYNWPAEYDLTLPHNIVHMVTVDQSVIVSTDSHPYVIDAPLDCENRRCKTVTEVDVPLPDIGCGYAHSAIPTPFGMVYSTKDGLVLIMPNAQFQIITAAWYSTDDWVKMRPDTVRLAYWRGYIICVTDAVSFMLEIDGNTYKDFELGNLVTISDTPTDMFVTNSGELLFLENRVVSQWNAGSTLRPYSWESRELSFGGEASPTTAKVRTDDILFKLLTPYPDLVYSRRLTDETPFRLGRLGRHLFYRMGFYGTGTVEFAELGMTKTTVNVGQ